MAKGKIVKKPRRKVKLSASVVLFAVILIYFAYHLINGCLTEKLTLFEVGEKVSLIDQAEYTGIILRSEQEVKSAGSGYVNFYIPEGSRTAVGDIVYSIDENGQYSGSLLSAAGTSELSRSNLDDLVTVLDRFSGKCSGMDFLNAYELQNSLDNKLMSFVSHGSAEALADMGIDAEYFTTYQAQNSGLVCYYTDGYETVQPASLKAEDFNEEKYTRVTLKNGDLVEKDSTVYKLLDSETWSIVIPLSETDTAKYAGLERIKVYFPETGLTATTLFSIVTGADGGSYAVLTLSRYMIQYADSRFLKVKLQQNDQEGLKIPASSVVKNSAFQIPAGYLTKGGNSNQFGFNAEIDGEVRFQSVTVVDLTEEYVFVSMDSLSGGTVLHMPESSDTFTVGMTSEIEGVYVINKGYAVFKKIDRLEEDGNYILVRDKADYSISTYDHVLLDGSLGNSDLTIY